MPLVIASKNRGKVIEFEELLRTTFGPFQPQVQLITDFTQPFSVEETGSTFAANAQLKAEAALAISGLPSMGDDSGLCVDVLNGDPGINSARWLGDQATDHDRNAALLHRLEGIPNEQRTAYFECVLCVAFPDGSTAIGVGRCHGCIVFAETGEGGFGYDSIFMLSGANGTFAQIDSSEKNRVSHRTLALRDLRNNLTTHQYALLK